ncbi:MAG TPA: erythromycin esterase family protein, partial [Opitutus sp.]|nr:erythromycin esterase family protein [Opitutus sp.]
MSVLSDLVRECAVPLNGSAIDYDQLIERVGDAHLVLLGEATHGTHEFYRERAQITKRLIKEKRFQAIAVEADWPDSCRVNRFVRGMSDDEDATDALAEFERFPQWMWRNADVLDFVGWLRAYNDDKSPADEIGFYGLDLYSLHASIEAIIAYLTKMDTAAGERARVHYACFDRFDRDPNAYGLPSALAIAPACEEAVIHALAELRGRHPDFVGRDGSRAADEYFCAERNAVAIKNAEHYYRTMFRGEVSSWNLRDNHMLDTLQSLMAHLDQERREPKVV